MVCLQAISGMMGLYSSIKMFSLNWFPTLIEELANLVCSTFLLKSSNTHAFLCCVGNCA